MLIDDQRLESEVISFSMLGRSEFGGRLGEAVTVIRCVARVDIYLPVPAGVGDDAVQ